MELVNDANPFITTSRFDDLLCDNLSNKSNNIRTDDNPSDSLENTTPNLEIRKNLDDKFDDFNNINI